MELANESKSAQKLQYSGKEYCTGITYQLNCKAATEWARTPQHHTIILPLRICHNIRPNEDEKACWRIRLFNSCGATLPDYYPMELKWWAGSCSAAAAESELLSLTDLEVDYLLNLGLAYQSWILHRLKAQGDWVGLMCLLLNRVAANIYT